MPADQTVNPVSYRARHNSEKPHPRRPARQFSTDAQPGFAANKKTTLLDQDKRIHLPSWRLGYFDVVFFDRSTSNIRLQRGELKPAVRVMSNNKTHRPFTQITNPIEEDQVFTGPTLWMLAHALNSMTPF